MSVAGAGWSRVVSRGRSVKVVAEPEQDLGRPFHPGNSQCPGLMEGICSGGNTRTHMHPHTCTHAHMHSHIHTHVHAHKWQPCPSSTSMPHVPRATPKVKDEHTPLGERLLLAEACLCHSGVSPSDWVVQGHLPCACLLCPSRECLRQPDHTQGSFWVVHLRCT